MLTSRCMIALAGILALIFLTSRTAAETASTSARQSDFREAGREARSVRLDGTASFTGLGFLPDRDESYARGVSANGRVVVGESDDEAFRWEDGEMIGLGFLDGMTRSRAHATNAMGSVVVGRSWSSDTGFRWTAVEGMTGLEPLPGHSRTTATAVSYDGSIIAGDGNPVPSVPGLQAYRWVDGIPMGLGVPPGAGFTRATGVSADGSVVVGRISGSIIEAFRWEDGIMVGLGVLPGTTESRARGVSADGTVVVGRSGSHAFRWDAEGMTRLLGLQPEDSADAEAVNADGTVIVGKSSNLGNSAFIWTNGAGRRIQDLLVNDYGLDLTGWTLVNATGVSADGRTIVGTGNNPDSRAEAWIARLPSEPVAAYFWEGLDGDFDDETNWDPLGVPGANDLAIYDKDQFYTVTFEDVALGRTWIERGAVMFAGGSYTLETGALNAPSFVVGNDVAENASLFLGSALSTTFATVGRMANSDAWVRIGPSEFPELIGGGPWTNQGRLAIGDMGQGFVTVEGPGRINQPSPVMLSSDEVILGMSQAANGHLGVSAGGQPDSPSVQVGSMAVGLAGEGEVTLFQSALASGEVYFGFEPTGVGTGTLTGSTWEADRFVIGHRGSAGLQLEQGSFLTTPAGAQNVIADTAGSYGVLSLDGQPSTAFLQNLTVGKGGTGTLVLGTNTSVLATQLLVGAEGSGRGDVRVLPLGVLAVEGPVVVGAGGAGPNELILETGGEAVVVSMRIGTVAGNAINMLLVENGDVTIEEALEIGPPPGGDIEKNSGAAKSDPASRGLLVLQDGAVLTAGSLYLAAGSGIHGYGTVELAAGSDNLIEGTIAAGIYVAGGKTLIDGPIARSSGFADLTVTGDLDVDGGTIELAVGGAVPGQADRLVIDGDLDLTAATLSLNFVDGYGPQEGDALQFVSVSGAFDGTFGEVVITGLEEGFEFDLDLEGGEVVLVALNDATVGIEPGETLPDPEPVITALRLQPNQPNPFNPQTVIVYEVPRSGAVRLEVFDLRGRLVRTLVDQAQSVGRHEVLWDGRDAQGREQPSGVYLSRLRSGGREVMGRMTLVR